MKSLLGSASQATSPKGFVRPSCQTIAAFMLIVVLRAVVWGVVEETCRPLVRVEVNEVCESVILRARYDVHPEGLAIQDCGNPDPNPPVVAWEDLKAKKAYDPGFLSKVQAVATQATTYTYAILTVEALTLVVLLSMATILAICHCCGCEDIDRGERSINQRARFLWLAGFFVSALPLTVYAALLYNLWDEDPVISKLDQTLPRFPIYERKPGFQIDSPFTPLFLAVFMYALISLVALYWGYCCIKDACMRCRAPTKVLVTHSRPWAVAFARPAGRRTTGAARKDSEASSTSGSDSDVVDWDEERGDGQRQALLSSADPSARTMYTLEIESEDR